MEICEFLIWYIFKGLFDETVEQWLRCRLGTAQSSHWSKVEPEAEVTKYSVAQCIDRRQGFIQ